MFLVWVVGVVFLVSWALTWCVRGAQEAMPARLPVGTEVPREERGVIHVAFALGISECEVLELHRTGQMPPPCTERPLRWERGVIDPWIGECLLRSLLERSGPGARMLERLESLGQGDLLAILGMGLPADEALRRPVVVPIEETDEAVLGELARRPAVPYDLKFLERVLGAAERLLGENEGNKKKEVFSSWNVDHLGTLGVPREGDTRMAGPVLPSGDSGDFPWDDWTQRTTPFLWNLADIAHRLALPVKDVESMHACGLLPPPVWPDPPLWHGQVIDPWMRDVPADVDRVSQVFLADQQGIPVPEIEATLVGFGLVGLGGLARRTGCDLTTLRQWYWEGCPVPLPHPDMSATNLDTGIEEPYWFLDGHIRKWLERMNTKKPADGRGRVGKERAPHDRRGSLMGKIYDRLRRDFDATLTAMSTEASPKDLAEDFPRVMSLAASLDTPIEKIVPFADKLAQARLWSGLEVDRETLESSTAAGVFARGIRGVRLTRTGAIETAASDLAEVLRSPLLPAGSLARDFFRFQKAYANIDNGLCSVAAMELDALVAEDGLCGGQARYWRAHLTATVENRFSDALVASDSVGGGIFLDIRRQILCGDVYQMNACLADAETAYTRALDLARQAGAEGLEGRALMHLAETLAWVRPEEGRRVAFDAIEKARKQTDKVDEFRSWLALAVADAGIQPVETVREHIRKAAELDRLMGGQIGQVRVGAAEAFVAAVMSDSDVLQQARQTVASVTGMLGSKQFQNDVLTVWSGTSSVEQSRHSRETQWLDGPDEALHRWREVVTARQGAA